MKMGKYDRMLLNFEIFVFILGIINTAWAIAKAILIKWNPLTLSMTSLTIYITFFVGLYFIQFTLRDFIHYNKHKKIEHEFDERTVRILSNSWRNAATAFVMVVYGAVLYYELFYETTVPLFSIRSIEFAVIPGILVFLISWLYYQRIKWS